jgi:hypothetical protein
MEDGGIDRWSSDVKSQGSIVENGGVCHS